MKKVWFMLAMMVCIFASCSDGGGEEPITPTPKPEEVKTEITIDSGIISNGLSFDSTGGEQSVSFSVNANWTLSIASTTSGTTWCKASATSGSKGTANVKFAVSENTDYEDRSVSVTIKAETVSKNFTITQKSADALLVATTKYEVAQEGGQIEVEVKSNISYQMEVSEEAKGWITEMESKSRALTTSKHKFEIAMNKDAEKREGEITFKSGDKVEIVKVYQAGGAILLLSQNEYTVSDASETISVDIKSNIDFGVQMPDVDWIIDEASSRGLSSHTLKYVIKANEEYDSRSAEIVFFDKNSDLKDTLKVVQAQKDAIILSQKEFIVEKEGGIIEVELNTNVNFEVLVPSDVTWVTQTESRSLTKKSIYLKVSENLNEGIRNVIISIINRESKLDETIIIRQQGNISSVTLKEPGTLVSVLGDDYLNINSLKIVGSINGTDIYYLRQMLGGIDYKEANRGKLSTLDLSEATIVEGGLKYYRAYYKTSNDVIGEHMFGQCTNLMHFIMPNNVKSIEQYAFFECTSLVSVTIGENVTSIRANAFKNCSSLNYIDIPDCVTSIGYFAFEGCSSLASVIIGDGVTSIGNYAFRDCSSITSLTIGDSVATIGEETFGFCSSLTSVEIGNSVNSIGEGAFRDCSSLTSVSIGHGVTSIGKSAFYLCNSVHSVYITDIFSWLNIEFGNADNSNPLHNGAKLYLNNKELTELVIPENIKEIKKYAFHGCETLKKVTIGDNVTSINSYAFRGCDALTSVTIGDGVTTIGEFVFYFCDALTSVTIGENVDSIGRDAFKFCSLTEVYCYAVTPPVINTSNFNSSFEKHDNQTILYVPAQYGSKYKSSSWGTYFKNVVEID